MVAGAAQDGLPQIGDEARAAFDPEVEMRREGEDGLAVLVRLVAAVHNLVERAVVVGGEGEVRDALEFLGVHVDFERDRQFAARATASGESARAIAAIRSGLRAMKLRLSPRVTSLTPRAAAACSSRRCTCRTRFPGTAGA